MNTNERLHRRRERSAKLLIWLAARASRNQSLLDRMCRKLLDKVTYIEPTDDFMRDPLIDNDQGFDLLELEKYHRGELRD